MKWLCHLGVPVKSGPGDTLQDDCLCRYSFVEARNVSQRNGNTSTRWRSLPQTSSVSHVPSLYTASVSTKWYKSNWYVWSQQWTKPPKKSVKKFRCNLTCRNIKKTCSGSARQLAARGSPTHNPRLTRAILYQLSFDGPVGSHRILAGSIISSPE